MDRYQKISYDRRIRTAKQCCIAYLVLGIIFIILGVAFILPCAMIFTDGSTELVEKLFVEGGLYFTMAFVCLIMFGIFLLRVSKNCRRQYKGLCRSQSLKPDEAEEVDSQNKKKQKRSVSSFKRKSQPKENCKERNKLQNKKNEDKFARLKFVRRIWLIICIFIWVISFILTVTQILHPKYFFPIAVYPMSVLAAFDIPVYLEIGVKRYRGKIVNSFGWAVFATVFTFCMATIFLVSITLA